MKLLSKIRCEPYIHVFKPPCYKLSENSYLHKKKKTKKEKNLEIHLNKFKKKKSILNVHQLEEQK